MLYRLEEIMKFLNSIYLFKYYLKPLFFLRFSRQRNSLKYLPFFISITLTTSHYQYFATNLFLVD